MNQHITFLCSRLDLAGGIERAVINTANLFHSKGHKVSMIILDESREIFFPLHPSIVVSNYNLNFGITPKGNAFSRKILFFRHLRTLKKIIFENAPDIVIASEYHLATTAQIVLANSGIKLISWEHHHFYHLKRNRFWEILFKRNYPKIHRVVCLNQEEAQFFQEIDCKTVVIPNHLSLIPENKANLDQKRILTIGYLNKTKGIDLLPEIAQKVFKKYPDWKWNVIGYGEEESKLKSVGDFFEIQPITKDIGDEYGKSAVYVLSSRFECFPMVLMEAMSLGIPCIAFDCPTGPRHIIKHNEDGILVEKEDTEAMANAVIYLIEHPEKRKQLGSNAAENIKRFAPDRVYRMWEELFHTE